MSALGGDVVRARFTPEQAAAVDGGLLLGGERPHD